MKKYLEEVVRNQDRERHESIAEIKNNSLFVYNFIIEGDCYMNKQDIKNSGYINNSIGDNNNITLNHNAESLYDSAIKEIEVNIQGEDKKNAKDVVELIEGSIEKENPKLAQQLFNSLPTIVKSLPSVIQIGEKIASLF